MLFPQIVTGAYDLYKNLDPTKLIKGTMKVRVLSLYFSLGAIDYSFFAVGCWIAAFSARKGRHGPRSAREGPRTRGQHWVLPHSLGDSVDY